MDIEKNKRQVEKVEKVDVLALLPKPLTALVEKMSVAFQVPVEIPLGYSLSILSGAIGNSCRISPKEGWSEPPYLWIMIVAPSGTGKTPCLNALMEPIYEREKTSTSYVSDFTLESLPSHFKEQPRGLICAVDELRSLFTRLGQYKAGLGDDLERLSTLWTGGPIKVNRVNKEKDNFSPSSGLSICGGIQPEALFSLNKFHYYLEVGLLPRFLFLFTEPFIPHFSEASWDEKDYGTWRSLVDKCYQQEEKTIFLKREAKKRWENYYNEAHYKRLSLSTFDQNFIPKLISYSLRIALLLSVIEDTEANLNIIEQAIQLTNYFEAQAFRLVEIIGSEKESLLKVVKFFEDEGRKKGKIPLAKIAKKYAQEIWAEKVSSKEVGNQLRSLNLKIKQSTGGRYYLIWPSQTKSTFSTISTENSVTSRKKKIKCANAKVDLGGESGERETFNESDYPEVVEVLEVLE